MDLSGMSAAELRGLQEKVSRELKKRESEEVATAREKILAIAQSIGMPLKDILATTAKPKAKESVIRFRHPDNASLEWSGRGRKPKWVNDWEASKSIEDLRV